MFIACLQELSLEALQEAACPATLRPHLQRLARLKQGQPHGRDRKPDMWHYQEMYASIMLDELTTRPVVLIVDNFHLLDVASIGVFSHLLSLASRQQQDETPHRYPLLLLGTANISSLSALDEVHSTSSAKALETLQRLPNVTTYTLSPLSNGAVEDMIKLDLGCDNLSRELVSVVTGACIPARDSLAGQPSNLTPWPRPSGLPQTLL